MKIAVDFDGTCVEHMFPEVGQSCPGATKVLSWLAEQGHELILYTMRSGKYLEDAIDWFAYNDIPLSGVQYAKGQSDWTCSNKCYAHIYIDDAALGAPLVHGYSERPYYDWDKALHMLKKRLGQPEGNPIVKEKT